MAEVVIPPRSGLIGEAVFPGMVTDSGDLVVLAVHRKGEELAGESTLAAGDALLLRGAWGALEEHLADPDVLVVDEPELVRRQAGPLGTGAKRALLILLGMVVLLTTVSCRRLLPDFSPPARSCSRACSRWRRRTGRSPGRP